MIGITALKSVCSSGLVWQISFSHVGFNISYRQSKSVVTSSSSATRSFTLVLLLNYFALRLDPIILSQGDHSVCLDTTCDAPILCSDLRFSSCSSFEPATLELRQISPQPLFPHSIRAAFLYFLDTDQFSSYFAKRLYHIFVSAPCCFLSTHSPCSHFPFIID